ncbi:alpha/beta hydrolase [Thiohalorhabdus sp. Cl-TMA]|uniref:Alpha/beta hydrolase n=1 Tax=Thiohalorhabdus methylotrophus TaxID=3242694 RepID=A0ABV4TTK9_9GAMM
MGLVRVRGPLRALLLLCLPLLPGCTGLFFYPDREMVLNPATLGLGFEQARFRSVDGVRLHGWYLPAETERSPAGTVLFLHGNAENISNHLQVVDWLPGRGFNVFLFDYRGYGRSGGEVELEGVLRDVRSALAYLAEREPPGVPLAVLGQSLGGALAPYAVTRSEHRDRVEAVVLDSAFSGFRTITREKLASVWITWPFQWLAGNVEDRFSPLRHVPDLAPIPLLVSHNLGDEVVPPSHAMDLYWNAVEPKRLWLFPDGRHGITYFRPQARDLLAAYLWERFGQPGEPPEPGDGMPPFHLDTP